MADFNQAIKWMKEGRNVRRIHWKDWSGFHLYNADGIGIMFSNNRHISDKLSISDLEATDWEIYEEKIESLSIIAREHNVSPSTIRDIIRRKTWKQDRKSVV